MSQIPCEVLAAEALRGFSDLHNVTGYQRCVADYLGGISVVNDSWAHPFVIQLPAEGVRSEDGLQSAPDYIGNLFPNLLIWYANSAARLGHRRNRIRGTAALDHAKSKKDLLVYMQEFIYCIRQGSDHGCEHTNGVRSQVRPCRMTALPAELDDNVILSRRDRPGTDADLPNVHTRVAVERIYNVHVRNRAARDHVKGATLRGLFSRLENQTYSPGQDRPCLREL